MSTGRADGPTNPGEGGEARFEEAEGVTSTSSEETAATDPAEGTADGAVEPPD